MEPIVDKDTFEKMLKAAGIKNMPTREESYRMMNQFDIKIPPFLYRFQSTKRIKQVLQEKQIFIQTPAKMNDIFDFQPIFDYSISQDDAIKLINELDKRGFIKEVGLKEKIINDILLMNATELVHKMKAFCGDLFIHLFEEQKLCTKILCFIEHYDNQLLWAHYADEYKGVCVQYNFTTMDNVSKLSVRKVIYDDNTPSIKIYDRFLKPMDYLVSLVKTVLIKNTDWKYENEWRLVLADQFGTWCGEKRYIPLRDDFITSIIFGVRTPIEEIIEIRDLVKGKEIELFKCYLDDQRSRKFKYGHLDKEKISLKNELPVLEFYDSFA